MEPGIRTNGQGNVSVCPIVWVILRKEFLYLHQYSASLSGCLAFLQKKILYCFCMLYLSQEWHEEALSDCLGYFTERVFIFISAWLLLSDCLAFYEEKVFILLCFYMLYLSQEQYELYKIYNQKEFLPKKPDNRTAYKLQKIYKFKKSFHQKSQTIGQSITVKDMYLKRVFAKKAGQSDSIKSIYYLLSLLCKQTLLCGGEPRRIDSLCSHSPF